MKVTNAGVIGNPFTNLSSDPSAQWPGPSGVEYLDAIVLAVGAVNPSETDPSAVRRVSSGSEWRPASLGPEDRIYRAHEGIVGGRYLTDDDRDFLFSQRDPRIDEEFLDGRDNDGDGCIDEDYAAFGQLMFSCVMRDDTPAAINTVTNEIHRPLGLECRQAAWAYTSPDYSNFNVIEYTIYNRSGHTLDSLYIGFPTDLDAGSIRTSAGYFQDDQDLPFFPNGKFSVPVPERDGLYTQCQTRDVWVRGFSVVDNDGDNGQTPGVASLLLFGHTIDPLGLKAPTKVGFRSFRSYWVGMSFANKGGPTTDKQRYQFMSSQENVDSLINARSRGQPNDYLAWNAVGPFMDIPDGGSVTATIGFAVGVGTYVDLLGYPEDYRLYRRKLLSLDVLLKKYPALENALTAQLAYEGVYERPRLGFASRVPNCSGCEAGIRLPLGTPSTRLGFTCESRETELKIVTDRSYTWFDADCDFCTGVRGMYLRRWVADAPPISPNLNVAADYNYSDNPDRVVAGEDQQITLAWDNLSENLPDPNTGWFDFRTYRIWKAAEWRRPAGSAGPNEDDWMLLSELRLFDYADSNFRHDPVTDTLICPKVFLPNYEYPAEHGHCAAATAAQYPDRVLLSSGGCRDSATVSICLRKGDLWDRQSGQILRPDPTAKCVLDESGECVQDTGLALRSTRVIVKTRYDVGRYRYVDREVKNGFMYFYSITAGDSIDFQLFGRRTAVESEGVTPQASTRPGKGAWVVPNPYRGYRDLGSRPSSWDLAPSATDPTGSHIDFMGLPPGKWTIRIYTVSGDLVAELRSDDPVNTSVRGSVVDSQGNLRPGYNRQQDHPNDGQARWNLLSRNGQEVVSGIYLFVVESDQGQQRGKLVIIR